MGRNVLANKTEPIEQAWPNFSLRPGFTRADLVLEVGSFDPTRDLWPWRFETLWACRYLMQHPHTIDAFAILHQPLSIKRGVAAQRGGVDYHSTYDTTVKRNLCLNTTGIDPALASAYKLGSSGVGVR